MVFFVEVWKGSGAGRFQARPAWCLKVLPARFQPRTTHRLKVKLDLWGTEMKTRRSWRTGGERWPQDQIILT